MTRDDVHNAVSAALTPDHFYLNRNLTLRIEHRLADCLSWEIFRGHLLDRSQTRAERTFESWLVFLMPDSVEPTLAIRWDAQSQRLHFTRSILVHGHEAYEQDGVIQSREIEKWHRELVGTIEQDRATDVLELQKLIEDYLFLAVIGTSRLPITSLESPLPEFTFGRLGYFPGGLGRHDEGPLGDPACLLAHLFLREANPSVDPKLIDLAIRALPHDRFEAEFARFSTGDGLPNLFKGLFHHLALSPYTDFVPKMTRIILQLPAERSLSVFSYLLRHLVRHLTAFDLHVFHNRGANYPDALALDSWLGAYGALIEANLSVAESRLIRRALRQAWLVRKQLEGLRVPDHPTSPGENLRVLPEPFGRLPEAQVLQPDQRSVRLFEKEPAEQLLSPAVRRLLEQSLRDLEHEAELMELGMAVFLDRPFGVFKQAGEVDRTPLYSYQAFSRTIAMSRLNAWKELGFLSKSAHGALSERLPHLEIKGIPVLDLPGHERPGVVALEDAIRASPDFVILRATRGTTELFERTSLRDPAVRGLPARWGNGRLFPIRAPRSRLLADSEAFLTVCNERLDPVIEFGLGQRDGGPVRYRERAGVEYLAEGLRVLRYWNDTGREVTPSAEARG